MVVPKRLPYVIYSANEVFQKAVSSIFSESPNSLDDITILERTLAEYENCLPKVLLKVKESGFKLN